VKRDGDRHFQIATAAQARLLFPERGQVYRYRAPLELEVLHAEDTLEGGELLPGFAVRVGELFRD
jgi:hypothetical protein